MFQFIIAFLILLNSSFLFAQSHQNVNQPKLVALDIQTTFAPRGFDSNDKIQIVTESWLPSTCYKAGPYQVTVDRVSKTIHLTQMAYLYSGIPCLEVMTPMDSTIEVGLLGEGSYTIQDSKSEKMIGKIPVRRATIDQPDNFLYAYVTRAHIDEKSGARKVLISGVFYNSCLRLKEARAMKESYNVVTVLPISEVTSSQNCHAGYFPFETVVTLPTLPRGRYLLQVRSMNGQSLTEVFDAR